MKDDILIGYVRLVLFMGCLTLWVALIWLIVGYAF